MAIIAILSYPESIIVDPSFIESSIVGLSEIEFINRLHVSALLFKSYHLVPTFVEELL
jgi:hypothetical protein